jgi:hypothetical protein
MLGSPVRSERLNKIPQRTNTLYAISAQDFGISMRLAIVAESRTCAKYIIAFSGKSQKNPRGRITYGQNLELKGLSPVFSWE